MTYSQKKILVIDDDSWMQRLLTKIFAKMDITNVIYAADGFKGINMAIEEQPDVIFLDLMMPVIDGTLVLKIIKSITLTKNIPVIIITGNSDVETVGAVLSSGAADFVAKPFTYVTVMEKLEKIFLASEKKGDFDYEKDNAIVSIDIDNDDVVDFFADFSIENNTKETQSQKEKEDLTKKYRKDSFGNTYEIKKIISSRDG